MEENEIMPLVATWMALGTVILSEVGQTEKEKYLGHRLCLESKNEGTNELIYKTEIDSRT